MTDNCKMPGQVHRAKGCGINHACASHGRCLGWAAVLPMDQAALCAIKHTFNEDGVCMGCGEPKAEEMTFGLPNRTGGYEHGPIAPDKLTRTELEAQASVHGGSRASGPLLEPGTVKGILDKLDEIRSTPKLREDFTAKDRKERPLCAGVLDYFPDALLEVAYCSYIGNEQHNPGEPLHWAKEKSSDEPDAQLRHLIDRGTLDKDGVRHSAKNAWRALALLQREIDAERRAR